MNKEEISRPIGLTIIAIFWLISGIIHGYLAYEIIRGDLESLQYLPVPEISEWFGFAVPTELTLSIILLCLAVLQILTVPGLLAGKKYSRRLALAIPVAFVTVNLAFLGLYSSAPFDIPLGNGLLFPAISSNVGMFWVLVYFQYLEKPNVKTFLGIEQPTQLASSET